MNEQELQLKKLELELARQKDDQDADLKKLELKLARQKFWIGSVALVIATALLNWQIQRREVRIKEIEKENTHLSQFVEKILDQDPLTRLYIAEYFQTLSYSDDARDRWKQYSTIAKGRVEEERLGEKKRMEIEYKLGSLVEELSDPATSEARAKLIQEEIFAAKIQTSEVVRRLEALNPRRAEDVRNSVPSRVGIIGPDDRIKVSDTTSAPWSRICSLRVRGQDGDMWIGTGFLVSPRLVLTVRYVVEPRGEIASSVAVSCGRDGQLRPFPEQESSSVKVGDPIGDDGDKMRALGAVVLRSPVPGRFGVPLRVETDESLSSAEVTIAGYPGDKEGGTQWRDSGPIERLERNLLFYAVDTVGGTSGAPVLVRSPQGYQAVGIHAGGSPKRGLRVTAEMVEDVNRWIRELETLAN